LAAEQEMKFVHSDPAGIRLMASKAIHRVIKLKGIRPPVANIIKQEMLSFGGEAATAYGSINHSVSATDILILGTLKQLQQLMQKLKQHQFGLPRLAEEMAEALNNYDATPKAIKIGKRMFGFGKRTYIMGVLNITPDSFSDGGKYLKLEQAVEQAKRLWEEGADIIDVGGESTRPGARPISVQEEKKRVLPVIERLTRDNKYLISIDTTKAEVAEAALSSGAQMVNDISGLRFDPRLAKIVAKFKVPLCIMHIKGKPRKMQENPVYSDLMSEIINYLAEGLEIAKKNGILPEKIMIDPGIGFGKTLDHNLEILRHLQTLKGLGRPIMIGTSRKSFIGKTLGLPVEERGAGTAASVAIAIMNGADFIRVHDVRQMARVAKMTDAIIRKG
jgi:dihydropteroate synthase